MTKWMLPYTLVYLTLLYTTYGQQTNIQFDIPQALELWDDKTILGNSTSFLHPVSLGTYTNCDEAEITNVFTSNYTFKDSYNVEKVNRNNYRDPNVRVVTGVGYRNADALREIEKKVLSAESCVLACITEKDFICRECDYFQRDGGKCALYATTGLIFQQADTNLHSKYVGDLPASDHYILYAKGENSNCSESKDEYAHSVFALGWKAMETGWYSLAQNLFDEAIIRDSDFYMAHVGKMLSHEKMGFHVDNYKDKMVEIVKEKDFTVKLSLQEQALVSALVSFQGRDTFDQGLAEMSKTLEGDTTLEKDYIIDVIEGNAALLRLNAYQLLESVAEQKKNVFALQLLTSNLNPYKNGKNRTSEEMEKVATQAMFTYQRLGVAGAWKITLDCVDIAEYYAEWGIGKTLLDSLIFFIAKHNIKTTSSLLTEDDKNIIVRGLNVTYMSKSLHRINLYERLHFFLLQSALFETAESHLEELMSAPPVNDDDQRMMLRYRMSANAYFSTYDYIYDRYSRENVKFEKDWQTSTTDSKDDLALASRAYYWAAAAVQQLFTKDGSVDDIKDALDDAKATATYETYKKLIGLYKTVVVGTEQRINGQHAAALESADEAGSVQKELQESDFTIEGNDESEEFRMLIPLGYQFKADTYRYLIQNDEALQAINNKITDDDVIESYSTAVNTPPQNNSRLLMGFAGSLQRRDEHKPRVEGVIPQYVRAYEELQKKAWINPEIYEGDVFEPTVQADAGITNFYDKVISGCLNSFEVTSKDGEMMCWGGYLIIGVAVGVVVIIVIIVGILCLRKKAKAPRKDKEKEGAFIFSGPNLSRQDSFGSSSHIGMSTLNRGSPETTAYASQTLSIQRPFHENDYTQRSNTIAAVGKPEREFEAYSAM